jgi:O-antigen ligase
MVSPVHGDHRRCQAEIPLIVLCRFPEPVLKVLVGFVGLAIICGGLWATSPNLQGKVSAIFTELDVQPDAPIGENQPSAALRLEFWRKSLRFFESAPILGHGTGSI